MRMSNISEDVAKESKTIKSMKAGSS